MSQSTSRPWSWKGITLIEMMIVLTLVGLLVALALPELQAIALRVRQTEREAMMTSILRAVNDYARAHGGALPGGVTPDLPRNPDHAPDGSRQPFRTGVGRWADLGWRPEWPLRFRYDVTSPAPGIVVVTAQADLDANGQVNVTSLTARLQEGVFQPVFETQSADPY